jgi:hypothetical protein
MARFLHSSLQKTNEPGDTMNTENRMHMPMGRRMGLTILGLTLVFGLLGAQEQAVQEQAVPEQPAPVQSIEELFLSRPVTVSAAEAMIASNDRDTQLMALRMLVDSAKNGTVDAASADYVELMSSVLRQGVTTISRNGSLLPDSYHPLLRMEAARALAQM